MTRDDDSLGALATDLDGRVDDVVLAALRFRTEAARGQHDAA